MIFLQKDDKPVFVQGIDYITENCFIANIRNHPAKEIKVHHARTHAEPIVIPAGVQFKIFSDREISNIPIDKHRNAFERAGIVF